jgi:hypothetical protein
MRLIKNKRGDKILSIYWFAVLIIVAGGIFGMVYVFYGTPYDVREIEARVLINQVADCVSYAGRIDTNLISNSQVYQKSGEDFLKDCHLTFKDNAWEDEQYYTEIDIYKLEDMNNSVLEINAGDNKWLSSCELQKDKEKERLAQCIKDSFYSVDDADNQYIIKILAVVRKSEKNVKM